MRRPIIGVTCHINDEETRLSCHRGTLDALLDAGVLPVLLPLTEKAADIREMADRFDGFVFTGGGDIDPELFRQSQKEWCGAISPLRDSFELELARLLAKERKPVLGICRGFQVLNVALGGDLYQDISREMGGEVIGHRQKQPDQYPSHPVIVTMSSLLDRSVHALRIQVNSLHHQAVRRLGEGFVPCGVAPDGIIEAAALEGHPFYLGVQWHPERMWQRDTASRDLFRAFADAAFPGEE